MCEAFHMCMECPQSEQQYTPKTDDVYLLRKRFEIMMIVNNNTICNGRRAPGPAMGGPPTELKKRWLMTTAGFCPARCSRNELTRRIIGLADLEE